MTKKKKMFSKPILYIKMANKYYEKHKERLRKNALERNQNLSEEEKYKRQKKLE